MSDRVFEFLERSELEYERIKDQYEVVYKNGRMYITVL